MNNSKLNKRQTELVRHHINPALAIRRFQFNSRNVIGIMKNDILFNKVIKDSHNKIGTEDSNMFIVEELNFFSQETIDEINDIIDKNEEFKDIQKLELTSLETSYNYYENLMALFLNKYLEPDNESENIVTTEDIDVIRKYIIVSELRGLKHHKSSNYLYPIVETDHDLKLEILLKIVKEYFCNYEDFSNLDELNLNEKAVFINILTNWISNNSDDFENFKIMNFPVSDFIKIYNFISNVLLESNLLDAGLDKIHFLKINSGKFIMGDNPVFTIYKNDEFSMFDIFHEMIFEENKDTTKITFMVISPTEVVVRTDSLAIISNSINEFFFSKLLNTLILYNSDRWFISQEKIIGDKSELNLFDFEFYDFIKESDFHTNKACKLLKTLNYYIGHLFPDFIFDFHITNPFKSIINNFEYGIVKHLDYETDTYIDKYYSDFILRQYKNKPDIGIFWMPSDSTMNFIQHLDVENTLLIKDIFRMVISKYLEYSPIKDEMQFVKYDKNTVIREIHTLKEYSILDKTKKLDCIYYVWLCPFR